MFKSDDDTDALLDSGGTTQASALKSDTKEDTLPASALAAIAAEDLAKKEQSPVGTFDIGSPLSSSLEQPSGESPSHTGEIPTMPQSSVSSSATSSETPTEEDKSPKGGLHKAVSEAFPADKMQNGMNAAKNLWSWGFKKVKENASKLGDEIAKSEFAKETDRLATQAAQKIDQGASEVARLAEHGSTKVGEKLEKHLQPALQEAGKHIEGAAKVSQEKAAELAEKMQPKLSEAKDTAKSGLFSVMGNAAKTAIWFQSLGSANHGSSDEEEEGSFDSKPPNASNATSSATTPPLAKAPGFEFMPETRSLQEEQSSSAVPSAPTVEPTVDVVETSAISSPTSASQVVPPDAPPQVVTSPTPVVESPSPVPPPAPTAEPTVEVVPPEAPPQVVTSPTPVVESPSPVPPPAPAVTSPQRAETPPSAPVSTAPAQTSGGQEDDDEF